MGEALAGDRGRCTARRGEGCADLKATGAEVTEHAHPSPLRPSAKSWGVPDWPDASAYPKPRDLTPRGWVWEFLRRNPEYRHAWAWEGDQRLAREARRFGLRRPLDPSEPNDDPPFDDAPEPRIYEGPGEHLVQLSRNEVAVVFDTTLPMPDQLAAAMKRLPKRADGLRMRLDKFPTYLRLLDAADAEACRGGGKVNLSRIAKAIYPDKSPEAAREAARNEMKAAEALRWGNYNSFMGAWYRLATRRVGK